MSIRLKQLKVSCFECWPGSACSSAAIRCSGSSFALQVHQVPTSTVVWCETVLVVLHALYGSMGCRMHCVFMSASQFWQQWCILQRSEAWSSTGL